MDGRTEQTQGNSALESTNLTAHCFIPLESTVLHLAVLVSDAVKSVLDYVFADTIFKLQTRSF